MSTAEPTEAQQKAKALWSGGAYEVIAERISVRRTRPSKAVGAGEGTTLLDVACGTGNACDPGRPRRREGDRARHDAAPARRRARARGRGRGRDRVRRGRRRRTCRSRTSRFDAVISVFGSMFAPDHAQGRGRARAGPEARRQAGRGRLDARGQLRADVQDDGRAHAAAA